jgi:hypothetical protein
MVATALELKPQPEFPDYTENYKKNLANIEAKRIADELAAETARLEAVRQEEERKRYIAAPVAVKPVYGAYVASNNNGNASLMGSYGYARAGGNCVNEPGVNNPGYGNPIDWPATSSNPWIGATFLFYSNHTGVVTGIWSNGDIEVRHQNFSGGQHRFPASYFRGYR